MPNAEYTTIAGDRWDTIAKKAYGDPMDVSGIADANPNIPRTVVFKGGVKLIIPIKEEEATGNNIDLLPPWKKVQQGIKPEIAAAVVDIKNVTFAQESFDKSFD
jgi:phage tail protein X